MSSPTRPGEEPQALEEEVACSSSAMGAEGLARTGWMCPVRGPQVDYRSSI